MSHKTIHLTSVLLTFQVGLVFYILLSTCACRKLHALDQNSDPID